MPEATISNEDIREIVRKHIGEVLDYYTRRYIPQGLVEETIAAILEIPNLAVVDRNAELPVIWDDKINPCKFMRDTGWVKEVKDDK